MYYKVAEHLNSLSSVRARPSDLLLASDEEVLLEAMDVSGRRGLQYRPDQLDLHYLLNARETAVIDFALDVYQSRYGRDGREDADLVVYTGDNSWNRLTWSAASGNHNSNNKPHCRTIKAKRIIRPSAS